MAEPVKIGQYRYCYGTANEANREMQFLRHPDGRIQASIYALFTEQGPKQISTLPGEQIIVEMQTTSEKMEDMMAARRGETPSFVGPPEKTLSSLPPQDQEKIIGTLEPRGPWRIEISNGFGDNPRFEKVVGLNFFNVGKKVELTETGKK